MVGGRSALLLALMALAACGGGRQVLTDSSVAVRVEGQRVVLAAPDGFCFDRRGTDVTRAGAVALAADCSVTGDAPEGPGTGAFITVSVSNAGLPGDLATLEGFLRTEAGTALLGKSADPEAKVTLVETRTQDGILLAKVTDTGTPRIPGASETFWRAFFEAADRLVGLSIVSFRGAALGDDASIGYLTDFADTTRTANSEPEPDVAPEAAAEPQGS